MEIEDLPKKPPQRDNGPIDVQMNNEVKLNLPRINDLHFHLMGMDSVDIIEAHSS